jgi:hypothetical protein
MSNFRIDLNREKKMEVPAEINWSSAYAEKRVWNSNYAGGDVIRGMAVSIRALGPCLSACPVQNVSQPSDVTLSRYHRALRRGADHGQTDQYLGRLRYVA